MHGDWFMPFASWTRGCNEWEQSYNFPVFSDVSGFTFNGDLKRHIILYGQHDKIPWSHLDIRKNRFKKYWKVKKL